MCCGIGYVCELVLTPVRTVFYVCSQTLGGAYSCLRCTLGVLRTSLIMAFRTLVTGTTQCKSAVRYLGKTIVLINNLRMFLSLVFISLLTLLDVQINLHYTQFSPAEITQFKTKYGIHPHVLHRVTICTLLYLVYHMLIKNGLNVHIEYGQLRLVRGLMILAMLFILLFQQTN